MQNKKPNILLITTDTQRCDTLACMGYPHAISPNLDRLAKEGVLFENAHTSSPVCSPARCSLLTGLHTPLHGCIENGISRREDLPVFPDFLKEQGYKNIMVGKTHFGSIPDSFDVQHVTKGEKFSDTDDCYARFIKEKGYSRVSMHPNDKPEDLCMDAFLVDTTIKEIQRVVLENQQPFFAFCSLLSPHKPLDPPVKWAKIYDGLTLPELNYKEGEMKNLPTQFKRLVGIDDEVIDEWDYDKIYEDRKLYYGLAAYCDSQIGKLIDFLDDSGLRENTLVIFTSDHGTEMFDHGFFDKHNFYDSSWRIPLIISMLGTLPSGVKKDFAIWNDITATILTAAGTGFKSIQGFDLVGPIKRGEDSPRKCAVGTLYKSCALATRHWKLEYYLEDGEGRLFDRQNDPLEQNNLYNNDGYTVIKNKLIEALLAWRSDIIDLDYFIRNTGTGGGPVARRMKGYIQAMSGIDSEVRLNERAKVIDEYN